MKNNTIKISASEAGKIELRSDEVNEIMGHIPNRIIRYGISVIAVVFMSIIAFSFIFKYPDVIQGPFYIQSTNPPAFLLTKTAGKIQSLFIAEADTIKRGDLLAIVENPTTYQGYLFLKELVSFNPDSLNNDTVLFGSRPVDLQLGELQAYYAALRKAVEEFTAFKTIDYHGKKRNSVKQKIKELHAHNKLLKQQIHYSRENLKIARKMFHRDSLLFISNTIAAWEYEKSQAQFLSQSMELTQSEVNLSNTRLNLGELNREIVDLILDEQKQISSLSTSMHQTLENLKGAITEWENRYCLFSPIAGKVAFSDIWRENQNVKPGQHVMTILPLQKSELISKIMIPVNRAGKVETGQLVNLKFIDFPYREFGMVIGNLDALSSVPDSAYVGTVYLSDSLFTNYGKHLPFKQNMQGVGEIITEDVSLAERLIYPLKFFLRNSFGR